MIDWLAHRVRATPDATAMIEADSGEHHEYAALDAAVERLATRLAALGFEPGDHLGALLETRPASVRLVHAAARLGCVLVPLSTRLTPVELGARIEHADLTGLICGADTERAACDGVAETEGANVPIASVDPVTSDGVTERLLLDSVANDGFDSPNTEIDDPQVMLFTSGTTGEPKLVVLTARNLVSSAVASAFRLGVVPGDRWLDPLSIYHMGGLAPIVRATIYGTTVVVPDTRGSFDPGEIRRALHEYDCTGISLVPTMLRRVLDAAEGSPPIPGALRFVLLGGAPASEALIERCAREDVPVCPTYGMTETTSQVATARPGEATANPGTVGHPLLATDLSILDTAGDPVEPGTTGEIVVAGPTVTPGYYDTDATAETGATAATVSEHGFHTGDVGRRDAAGRLWITGRRDDRIITGGETVDPAEIRQAVCDHPRVRDATVVGVPDPEYGQRVGALVVADGALDATMIETHCRERLAGFKRPRAIGFAASLPRTASGTVDRETVRDRLSDESG